MTRDANLPSGPAAIASPRAARRARVLRPWRWALLIYAIALTTATHWPRLELSPEIPASDKMIHMCAFGLLTALLWRADVIGNLWLTGVIAVAWAGIDELSQGLPGIHRTVSMYDMIANVCGVTCAVALIWALWPLHDAEQLAGPNRTRGRLFEFTFDEMFAQRRPWLIAIGLAALGAVVIAIVRPLMPSAQAVGRLGLIVAGAAALALYLLYHRIFFARFARVLIDKPCLDCGADQSVKRQTISGAILCGVCGAERGEANYLLPPRPPLSAVLRASIVPAMVALAGVAAIFTIVLVIPYFYGWAIATPSVRVQAPRLAQMVGRMPPELNSAIDLTTYLLLLAVVIRLWRRRMAAYLDRAVRCRRCGHDLHGTPTNERGEGHCGECGAAFRREFTTENAASAEKAICEALPLLDATNRFNR